ncbi:glycosyltransferase family 2 protein [Arthrobacter bambusae]|uniref:glycosyltransferase family 2 protein n=1 Tax=Arthrobacter bambusae TaxID=1338426 RepID=UPI00277E09E0|nr:glycosyltransferase family 2 protein [Arthrobacter bambusae]MDQ0240164.1 glycosyltransferase [Arthrobacter bambusae]
MTSSLGSSRLIKDAADVEVPESNVREAPKFSVITITRNDERGLERTIDSLMAQTYRAIEHIIIDGASTDGTQVLLRQYTPDFETVIVSEPDAGIYDAMNKGAKLANGDLVVFMNSGDVFGSSDTLNFVKDKYIAGSWRWGFGAMRYVDDKGNRIGGRIQAPFVPMKLFMGVNFVPHQATYMELSFLRELGAFNLNAGIAADQEMAIRATLVSNPAVWIEFLTDFLVGGAHSNISRWRREKIYHDIRVKQNVILGGSRLVDFIGTLVIAGSRSGRDWAAKAFRDISK